MIRITAHASDPSFLVLRIDQAHNRVVGSFEPARRQDDMGVGVYVMEADRLDSLQAWARYNSIHLLNEVRSTGEPTRALECANTLDPETGERCCAPYRAGHIPRYCGTCGQPANPVAFEAEEPLVGVKCPGCSRLLGGGPRFCPHCGTTVPDHQLRASALPRPKSDPMPLAEAVGEVRAGLHEGTVTT